MYLYKFILRNSNVSLIAFSTSLLTAEFDISACFKVLKCSGLIGDNCFIFVINLKTNLRLGLKMQS